VGPHRRSYPASGARALILFDALADDEWPAFGHYVRTIACHLPLPHTGCTTGIPLPGLRVTSPGDDRAGHCSEGHDHDHRDGEVEHDRHDRYEDAEQDRHEVGGDGETELLAGFL
jgi:hypothetical protein